MTKNLFADFCGHSGGALGSDARWQIHGAKVGMTNIKHYYHGQKTPFGNTELTDFDIKEGWLHVLTANASLGRQLEKYKSLLSRNWFPVKNSYAVFAIGVMANHYEVKGGTGWAVQMAIDNKRPVYVFDQLRECWLSHSYEKESFVHCSVPILTKQFAGVGTRELNEAGEKAIIEVYQETLADLINNENLM